MGKNTEHLSIKKFIIYSITTYPVILSSLLYKETIIKIIGSESLFFIVISLLLSILTWLFAQKNIQVTIAALATIIGLFIVIQTTPDTGTIGNSVFVYFLFYPIVTIYQVFVWIPFLVKFIRQNWNNIDTLKWG